MCALRFSFTKDYHSVNHEEAGQNVIESERIYLDWFLAGQEWVCSCCWSSNGGYQGSSPPPHQKSCCLSHLLHRTLTTLLDCSLHLWETFHSGNVSLSKYSSSTNFNENIQFSLWIALYQRSYYILDVNQVSQRAAHCILSFMFLTSNLTKHELML